MSNTGDEWNRYVAEFHQRSPGITESVLASSRDDQGMGPYAFATSGLSAKALVDVACGNGPAVDELEPETTWLGADRSLAELRDARSRGRGPVVAADAAMLPLRSGYFDAALCTMGLMVVGDPPALLAEARRVLAPGAEMRVLVPARGPLRATDVLRYAAMLAAIGRFSLPFPSPGAASEVDSLLTRCGFEVVASEKRRFSYPLSGRDPADRFTASLYMHGVATWRRRLARRTVRVLSRLGRHPDIGIPLRLVVARRRG